MNTYCRIIVTGGRNRPFETVYNILTRHLRKALESYDTVLVVEGGCPTGVDKAARDVASTLGCAVEDHPADWSHYGRLAGPVRNRKMAELGADCCLAFPAKGKSSGTWGMIYEAVKAGIPVIVYPENADMNNGAPLETV